MNKTVEANILEIVQKQIGEDNDLIVTSDSQLEDLNIDSLDFIEIIIAAEDSFNIEFTDDALYMGKFTFLSDLINYVDSLVLLKKDEYE